MSKWPCLLQELFFTYAVWATFSHLLQYKLDSRLGWRVGTDFLMPQEDTSQIVLLFLCAVSLPTSMSVCLVWLCFLSSWQGSRFLLLQQFLGKLLCESGKSPAFFCLLWFLSLCIAANFHHTRVIPLGLVLLVHSWHLPLPLWCSQQLN